jgi:hypothetical protein
VPEDNELPFVFFEDNVAALRRTDFRIEDEDAEDVVMVGGLSHG